MEGSPRQGALVLREIAFLRTVTDAVNATTCNAGQWRPSTDRAGPCGRMHHTVQRTFTLAGGAWRID